MSQPNEHAHPADPAADGSVNLGNGIIIGPDEAVEVKTTIVRTLLDLGGGDIVHAIPPGYQLAPQSQAAVLRRLARERLLRQAQEARRDDAAIHEAEAIRRPTGPLAIVQQDRRALPAPAPAAPGAAPALDHAQRVEQVEQAGSRAAVARVISPDVLAQEPDRFVVVSDADPRVQRVLAARAAPPPPAAAPPPAPARAARRGGGGWLLAVAALLILTLPLALPWSRPGALALLTALKANTVDVVRAAVERQVGSLPPAQPAAEGAPDEFTFQRAPSITPAQFRQLVAGTPLAADAQASYERVARAGYDPAILGVMAMAAIRSTDPADQIAQPAPEGAFNLFSISSDGELRAYASYPDAFADFTKVLAATYAPQGVATLPQFIAASCQAPACDAAATTAATTAAIRALRATAPPAPPAATATAGDAATAPTPGAPSDPAVIAEQSDERVTVTVTGIVSDTAPDGTPRTVVTGAIQNTGTEAITITGDSILFWNTPDMTGTPLAMSEATPVTILAGERAPFTIDLPFGPADPITMRFLLPPSTNLTLTVREATS